MRIIFFDGVCHLCQASVKFIIARDPQARFHFASQQSALGQRIVGPALNGIVLSEDGVLSKDSTAALRIAKQLSGPWKLMYAFIIVPRPMRDVVYRYIAKNRYRWFGKDDACWLPTPALKARFLEDAPTSASTA